MPTYRSRRSGVDLRTMFPPRYKPSECPHCEYDRRFPGFEGGGWMQQDNNGPIVSCPMCNDDGSHPQCPQENGS
jgi:hypothetical protein